MTTQDDDDEAGHKSPVTRLIHHDYRPPGGFEAVAPAVHKASTVFFPDVRALRSRQSRLRQAYTYGLHGTPTTYTLEERIAQLEGARHCVLTPSGLSALALVNLALLKPGDEVLLPDNAYGPSKEMARTLLGDWGISHRIYDPMAPGDGGGLFGPRTRLIWLEAAGSVTMEFPDLRVLTAMARRAGVLVALDNTWGCGLAFRPFDLGDGLGVDVCMHALTKYPSGGGDVLMGSVTTRDQVLQDRLLTAHARLGLGVGANDAEAILRGLSSLHLRYGAQDLAARELAAWLAGQSGVARVLHPALPGSPGHGNWKSMCSGAAGLFSVLIDERFNQEQVDGFVDSLQIFRIGYSWGGPVSLAVPYGLDGMRQSRKHLQGHLVRLSIGLEATHDLQADLQQALRKLAASGGR